MGVNVLVSWNEIICKVLVTFCFHFFLLERLSFSKLEGFAVYCLLLLNFTVEEKCTASVSLGLYMVSLNPYVPQGSLATFNKSFTI